MRVWHSWHMSLCVWSTACLAPSYPQRILNDALMTTTMDVELPRHPATPNEVGRLLPMLPNKECIVQGADDNHAKNATKRKVAGRVLCKEQRNRLH